MAYLIGTDEAGYGPNLGPLVVGLSVWQAPGETAEPDLQQRLSGVVTADLPTGDDDAVPLADSKILYQPARGLATLEGATLALWRSTGLSPLTWPDVWPLLTPADAALAPPPWQENFHVSLPRSADPQRIDRWAQRMINGLAAADVRLATITARAIQPREFNAELTRTDSKGALLSETTLGLVATALAALSADDNEPVFITCDKHGGRDRYLAVLQHVFPDERLEIVREGRAESAYRWRSDHRPVLIRFRAKGEGFLPAALASMTAKYLRELALEAFNAFWQREVPGLQPTAGYPLDAKRFHAAIRSRQQALAIADDDLWRRK